MGREVKGRNTFRMQAAKWAVAELQGDKTASFYRKMSVREDTERYVSVLSSMELYCPWISGPLRAS